MPNDPKECRAHALHCAELAEATHYADLRRTLLDVAQTWTELAAELEATHTPLHMVPPPRALPSKTIYDR